MGHSITHFMWGYQTHFRFSQEYNAGKLFQSLDSRFKPEVFLVGIAVEPESSNFPACVEPEDDYWIPSGSFNSVINMSGKLREEDPEANILHSLPQAQITHEEILVRRSIKNAVVHVVDGHHMKPGDKDFSVSFPVRVENYWVCVVLGLQKSVIKDYYSLQKSACNFGVSSAFVHTSLIEAVIDEFLAQSAEKLLKPNPGCNLLVMDTEEVLRSAGNSLMLGIGCRVDQRRIAGMNNLFRACTTISSLHYEQAEGAGSFLLATMENSAVTRKVSFASSVNLSSFRAARKLLELASGELFLHSDSEQIFGLSELCNYEENSEDVFEIHILGHHHWELNHAKNALMRVKYGLPCLPRLSFEEKKLRQDLPRLFKGISLLETDSLVGLLQVAKKEPHGTMLVITENASSEANRLEKQGTPIDPCFMTPDLLKHLTPIDGAVILSPEGMCHSIGTILDGKATALGDPGRGARYNSAIRYVETSNIACMALVFSEDGGVDFVPNLRPPINMARIAQTISSLKQFQLSDRINLREYRSLVAWLDDNRFYLKQEDCDTLNRLIPDLEDRIKREEDDESIFEIVREKFIVNSEMDESLYYG